MDLLDRIIWAAVALGIGAVAIPAAAPAVVTIALVGTGCFVVVRLVLFYTNRW
jgi:hypothetical protein